MQNATVTSLTNYDSSRFEAKKLGNEISELCSYIYAAESRLLNLIREFDEKEYWADLGLCSCAHWLNFKCGIGMNAAREKVRVARALATLPKIEKDLSQAVMCPVRVYLVDQEKSERRQ